MKWIRRFNESQTIKAKNDTIVSIVNKEREILGSDADLNHIDVSEVTSLYGLFNATIFNGDISLWNVENVENMSSVFYCSQFNGNISRWNVQNAKNMMSMFYYSQFNGDISNWNTKNVEIMRDMFCGSKFNGDISNWNVEKVKNMSYLFYHSYFNGDLNKWKPRSLTNYVDFMSSKSKIEHPIWYQCLELGLFKNGKDYCYSLDWDWLRKNKTISRFRLEEAVEHFGGDLTKIDQIKGFTFVN